MSHVHVKVTVLGTVPVYDAGLLGSFLSFLRFTHSRREESDMATTSAESDVDAEHGVGPRR
jgi:hypothetical protein